MDIHLILLLLGLVWLAVVVGVRAWGHNAPTSLRRTIWYDVLAGGVLFVLVAAFFWRTLSGDVYQPADGGDLVSFLFPTYRFAAGELAAGRLPLWNPALYGGAPFVGDIQAGFLYPPNLALFLANPTFSYTSLQWLAMLHMYWAGLGLYVLLRSLRSETLAPPGSQRHTERAQISRPAALFGALAFALCDPLFIHLGNLNLIAVLSWLPWILAAYARALDAARGTNGWRAGWGWAALAGVLLAVGSYAGHAQSTLYVGLALAIYTAGWLVQIFFTLRERPEAQAGQGGPAVHVGQVILHALALGIEALVVALLLMGPILLPALEMTRYTVRSEFTYQDAVSYSLAPVQAVAGLVTPGLFGRGPALHWSLWQRVELPYLGVPVLILAAGGLLLAGRNRRTFLWVWLAMAVFGLLLSLGVYGIVHGLLTWLVPFFDQFRAPARALILWALGMCVLAAVGFDLALGRTLNNMSPGPATASGRLKVQGTLGPRAFDAFVRWGALVLGVVAVPLSFLALFVTQGDETAFLRSSLAALALVLALAAWLGTWLILSAVRRAKIGVLLAGGLLIALLFLELAAAGAYTDISSSDPTRGFQHPEIVEFLRADPDLFRIDTDTDIAALWQPDTAALAGLQDVHGVANPLLLRSVRDFWQSTGGRQTRRYDLLNVKYVLVRTGTPLPEGKFERVFGPIGDLEVYRNNDFAPRAWWAPGDADLANLEPPQQPGGAQVTHNSPTAIDVQVNAPEAGYLILSETWYPGWSATVNGQAAPIEQVDGTFRAVPVPAGAAEVQLRYWPPSWTWGLVMLAAGVLLVVIAAAIGRSKAKRN
ncbi:MAG: YfhO family protein [Caldilineaceae bacterium]